MSWYDKSEVNYSFDHLKLQVREKIREKSLEGCPVCLLLCIWNVTCEPSVKTKGNNDADAGKISLCCWLQKCDMENF